MSSAVLREIEETRRFIDECYYEDILRLQTARGVFEQHMSRLETLVNNFTPDDVAVLLATPNNQTYGGGIDESRMRASPSMASPPVSRATLNYEHILDEVAGPGAAWQSRVAPLDTADTRKRPMPESIPDEKKNRSPPKDGGVPCQVLVVFKRKRMLQFESSAYVSPGEYVVVGGDRGEDIGLVTHSWTAGEQNDKNEKKWAEGVGRVLRVASALEVSQLQGVQTELEVRAVEVAQKKVEEHGLPMCIVDAEYQFDRKKLTFFYRSQQRLDFRNLVRDLYKTFRARIWMEADVPA